MSYRKAAIEPFRFVQRLRMRNKDNQVPFEERFEFDFMASPEFHGEWINQRLRELEVFGEVGEVMVDGVFVLVLYHSNRMTLKDVEVTLNAVYHGDHLTRERTNFNRDYRRLRKEFRWCNAWLEIENGLFWTWERVNIRDVLKNITRSVRRLEQEQAITTWVRAPKPPPAFSPLRQQLIDCGVLRPGKAHG